MNIFAILSNVILGSILLYSYYYFYAKDTKQAAKLWGNTNKKHKKLITLSIFVTGFLYLLTFYYISFKTDKLDQTKIKEIIIYQIILILASILWMPLSLKYLINKKLSIKIAIILILFVVAMCALAIFLKILKLENSGKFKNLALLGSGMLFFHTFFLDFLNWNYNFF